jgi:hypothetical protein
MVAENPFMVERDFSYISMAKILELRQSIGQKDI